VANYYVLDIKPTIIPKISQPHKRESYMDPIFGTRITRITDKNIDKYHPKYLTNIYSTIDIENSDGSYLLLGSFNYYLYDARTFGMIKHMGVKPKWGREWQARWHPSKPNVLYYLWGTQLRVRDLTGPCKAIKDDEIIHDFKEEFPEATYIGVKTKGTPSVDGRYWSLGISIQISRRSKGFNKALFYDIKEDKVLWAVECNNPKWLGTSMSGDYMIIAGSLPGREKGVWALKREDSTKVVKLAPRITHSDLAINCNGNEVYVYENSINDYIEMTELATGKTTKLISYVHETTWKELFDARIGGQHISGNSWQTPGWVLVSTYAKSPRDPNTKCWKRQVNYMLELKENPRIWRVCHNRSVQGGYFAQAFATINAKGTRAYWGSNWGDPQGRIEVYMLALPKNWHEDLMGKKKSTELKIQARKTLHLN
jgi:dipeptidyl aminopeptidase/acylaminoacyl peptidase